MFLQVLEVFWLQAWGRSKRHKSYGLPSALQNMDAAFIWERNYKTYFFKGGYYWRYNENSKSIDGNYPRPISVWGKKQSNDNTKALYFPVTNIMAQNSTETQATWGNQ